MKRFCFYLLAVGSMLACSLTFTACSDDEPENPGFEEETPGDDDEPETPTVNIAQLVKDNVSVKCTYSDYMFHFTIKSGLRSKLSSATINYGIEHDVVVGLESVVVTGRDYEDRYYSYSLRRDGLTDEINITVPMWYYYAFVEKDTNKWVETEMYYAAYLRLLEKGEANWYEDERTLYRNSIRWFKDCERDAQYYRPTVVVKVNDRFYEVAQYEIPE